jgi:flagellar L-ring protein precursor FlgH
MKKISTLAMRLAAAVLGATVLATAGLATAGTALADTLYVAAPPAAAPGHPLRLVSDHKASQVGDLVAVVFDFSTAASRTYQSSTAKGYSASQGGGQGLLSLPLLRLGGSATGSTASNASDAKSDASSFVSSMMATVTNVLPSGALQLEGDQEIFINGEKQKLHVIGYARPDDIDSADSIASTRLSNVSATYSGNDTKDHRGILRKVLDVLF